MISARLVLIVKVESKIGLVLILFRRSRLRSTLKVGSLGALTCLLSACQSQLPVLQVFPVDVSRIQTRDFAKSIQAEGTLKNPGYIQLKPQASGLITQVLVQEGDPVYRGQVLVVLDNAEQHADLRTAQAELKEALIQAKRYSQLALVGGVEKEQAEEKQIQVFRNQSKVVAKQEALDKRSMRSPINGIVGDLAGISPGQYLEEGQNNFVVVNNENLSIDLSIPALQASQIELGQRVEMLNESNSNLIGEGRISFIPPYFDFDTKNNQTLNTLSVRAVFVNKDAGLRPNQVIRSKIIIGNKQYPGLLATAALFKAQQPYTYKLIPIKSFVKSSDISSKQKQQMTKLPPTTLVAVETPLKLGELQDGYFPIISGLQAGDLIPVSGSTMLANGTPVSVKSAN